MIHDVYETTDEADFFSLASADTPCLKSTCQLDWTKTSPGLCGSRRKA